MLCIYVSSMLGEKGVDSGIVLNVWKYLCNLNFIL